MRKRTLKLSFGLRFLDISLIIIGLLQLVAVGAAFLVLYRIYRGSSIDAAWIGGIVVFFLSFEAIVAILLINLVVILDRTLAPLGRMEDVLAAVLAGDTSRRIKLREKDLLKPLADKINQLIALAQKQV